ncbi:MAG: response regulator [candidate division Zixibacteria bacterium]|jgi:two-component system response regulator FixJ
MPDEEKVSLHVIDDEELVRKSLVAVLQNAQYDVQAFASGVEFLKALPGLNPDCVILDVRMPQMSGLDVLEILKQNHPETPVVMMSGFADVSMAVKAMQSGASDFVEKPFQAKDILDTLERVLQTSSSSNAKTVTNAEADALLSKLSKREVEVLLLLVQGKQNKVVARELGISPRTVEVHRARIMQRLGVTSFAELVRLSVLSGLASD